MQMVYRGRELLRLTIISMFEVSMYSCIYNLQQPPNGSRSLKVRTVHASPPNLPQQCKHIRIPIPPNFHPKAVNPFS